MPSHDPPEGGSLATAREEAIEKLSAAFAHDEIDIDDFERRVDAAYAATDGARLRSLVQGLDPTSTALVRVRTGEMTAPQPATVSVVPAERPAAALAILGNLQRSGPGRLAHGTRAVAVLGNVEIDLRDVTLPPGVTDLVCRAVFGNIEVTVPPDLAVECVGAGILGSFSSLHRIPAEGAAHRPVLRILGSAVFGNVEVHTLPQGMPEPRAGEAPRRLPRG